jgi:uncharacterized protein (TIGR03437 family)
MERKRKLTVAKAVVVVAAIPILLWAYEYGPNPGYVGIPSENGGQTCANAGCHSGTANNPANKGSVSVTFPSGTAYIPGVLQHLTVTIADPAPTQGAWGFQLTARLASNVSTMEGTFAPVDANTQIMCSETNLQIYNAYCLTGAGKGCAFPSSAPACPANLPLAYMEHSYTGYLTTMGTGSGSYQIDWTPPATNVGNITFYVAGNAGVPGPPNVAGDHIYTTKYTLTPSAGGSTPTISGVSNAAGGQAGVFPNAYVSIYGSNFAPAGFTDPWDKAIVNGKLPTSLDNVTVNIGSQQAYVSYVSATQINILVPNVGLGSMPVTVSTSAGTSQAFTVNSQQYSPAFFNLPNNQPVATHNDATSSLAVKNGTYPSLTTVPAKPGEAIILWGTGFGPTNPATPFGVALPSSPTYYTATPVTATIGGTPAAVYATALSPGFAGLYQVVVTVPPSLGNNDYPLVVTVNGAQSPTWTLTVHN